MCNCKSYNWDGKLLNSSTDEEVVVKLPEFMVEVIDKDTVCIDSCIVDTIMALWENEIITLGCCCGHNEERPSVVVQAREPHAHRVKTVLERIGDNRNWKILTWELVEITWK
jgi:hypothetical protein